MSAIVAFLFLTLPWLNPFSPGPTPAVVPLLFSWICTVLVLAAIVVAHLNTRSTHSVVRALALAWLVAASVSALIGLLQYFGATAWAGAWFNHTVPGQAFGNLRQRNQFATLMNIGLAALLWWAANPHATAAKLANFPATRWSTAWLALLVALLSAGNAASSSRTGLMQLALLSALTWYWQRPGRQAPERSWWQSAPSQILFTAMLAYAAAMLALPLLAGLDPLTNGALARLQSGDTGCSSRLTLWSNVVHLIMQKPWLGWGWGELDYAHFITLFPGPRFCEILDNAHNLPLQLAVELGVPAAGLVCGTFAWLTWRARPWRELDMTRQMAWSVLLVIGLHSLLEYPLWYGPFQMAALASLWLLVRERPRIIGLFKPAALYLQSFIAICFIAFCLVCAWNYHLASQIYLPPEARLAAYQEDTQAKIRQVRLFQDQVRFAELTTTDLTTDNAAALHALALDMLHFSPEARVVEVVLDSARLLGRSDDVAYYSARYQAAFPQAYAVWSSKTPTR